MAYLKASRRFKMTCNQVKFIRPINVYFYYGHKFLGASHGTDLQQCLYRMREGDRLLNPSMVTPHPTEFRIDHHSGWDETLYVHGVPELVLSSEQDKEELRKNLVP